MGLVENQAAFKRLLPCCLRPAAPAQRTPRLYSLSWHPLHAPCSRTLADGCGNYLCSWEAPMQQAQRRRCRRCAGSCMRGGGVPLADDVQAALALALCNQRAVGAEQHALRLLLALDSIQLLPTAAPPPFTGPPRLAPDQPWIRTSSSCRSPSHAARRLSVASLPLSQSLSPLAFHGPVRTATARAIWKGRAESVPGTHRRRGCERPGRAGLSPRLLPDQCWC